MKVTGARASPCTLGRGGARGCLVELLTDSDLTGVAVTDLGVGRSIVEAVDALLLGEDPRASSGLWQRMVRACEIARDRSGFTFAGAAALDVALWDLKAKAAGEPLWRALGGSRPCVNAYASHPDHTLDAEALAAWIREATARCGLRGAKLAVAGDACSVSTRLEGVRAWLTTVDPECALMIDVQGRWMPKEAIRHLRALERDFDLTWVEGVGTESDFLGRAQVSRAARAAVCGGRGLHTLAEFLPHFRHRALDVVAIDVAFHGFTGAMQLADAAYALELPVTLAASPGNVAAHLGGVLPYLMSIEVIDPLATGDLATDVRIEGGWAVAGDAAGHGLTVRASESHRGGLP
jgi:L-alanine-DL-glutamate epimerase-like enolase superfamily enzyme